MRWIANGENLILLWPPGVGKIPLAVALGIKAVKGTACGGLLVPSYPVPCDFRSWCTESIRNDPRDLLPAIPSTKRVFDCPDPIRPTAYPVRFFQHGSQILRTIPHEAGDTRFHNLRSLGILPEDQERFSQCRSFFLHPPRIRNDEPGV